MKNYRIEYRCSNGYEGEEHVSAVNSLMAFEEFAELGYDDIVSVSIILEDDADDEEDELD